MMELMVQHPMGHLLNQEVIGLLPVVAAADNPIIQTMLVVVEDLVVEVKVVLIQV